VNSIYKIATGAIGDAANWVENAMARTLPVIISFLARLIGLGGISEKIKNIIEKVQEKVDKAIDKVIEKVVAAVGKLLGKGKEEKEDKDPEHAAKVQKGLAAIDEEEKQYIKEGKIEKEQAEKVAAKIKKEHPVFKSIKVAEGKETWDYEYEASPKETKTGEKKKQEWKVGKHVVEAPAGSKGGESHHVPVKVLQNWIGEVYEDMPDPKLKSRGTRYKNDKVGKDLSAVWLSETAHKAAHARTETVASEFEKEKDEILITTKRIVEGKDEPALATRPTRAGISRTVEEEGGIPKSKKKLHDLFGRVFKGLLNAGIAWVLRAIKGEGEQMKTELIPKAEETWEKKLDPDASD